MSATKVLTTQTRSIHLSADAPESPFAPPYRSDSYIEHPLVQLTAQTRMRFEVDVQNMHQEALAKLIRKVHSCPEPVPPLVARDCPPCLTEELRSERIHAVVQLLTQIREQQHQTTLRGVYKAFGSDHRKAAKELYSRGHFSIAYAQYWSLFTCLSCDKCRTLSAAERHNLAVDLLEKLAVTSLRAGWFADAENFADEALKFEKCSTRARIWLATAQLGLGKLNAARKNLTMLPRRGQFPRDFPPWIEARVMAQRAVLERLEQEAKGDYDILALELDAPDCTPETPHSTKLFRLEAIPGGYRTTAKITKGALLLITSPLVCAPCYTIDITAGAASPTPQQEGGPPIIEAPQFTTDSPRTLTMDPQMQKPPPTPTSVGAPPKATTPLSTTFLPQSPTDPDTDPLFSLALIADAVFEQAKAHSEPSPNTPQKTLHDEDPSLLSLAYITDTLYTQAKAFPHVRLLVRAAAARCGKESERVIDIVGDEIRAAAIVVAQNYTVSIPHVHGYRGRWGDEAVRAEADGSEHANTSAAAPAPCNKPVHAGHALYLSTLKLVSSPSSSANTYATFHGPHLFLRASKDLLPGCILTFDGFPGRVSAPSPGISPRARVTALITPSPSTSKTSSRVMPLS
ncbi:hypothetical protein K439DRAFT_1632615 [Ramaria rubella]|nr:hypothetical protein K439DRAFT_1632615 [Ramaria rubella]